jgi:hypothetical protein
MSSRYRPALALLAALTVSFACGVKGPPKPPRAASPPAAQSPATEPAAPVQPSPVEPAPASGAAPQPGDGGSPP